MSLLSPKPKPRWDGICRTAEISLAQPGLRLPHPAVSLRPFGWPARPGFSFSLPTQAQASGLLSRPGFTAGPRQVIAAGQPWRPQVLPHRLSTVGWRVVPDHVQARSASPSIAQEGNRRSRVAVAIQFHPLDLAGLQAHRRVVAGLLAVPGLVESTRAGSPLSTHLPRNSASARKWASSANNILAPVALTRLLPQGGVLHHE